MQRALVVSLFVAGCLLACSGSVAAHENDAACKSVYDYLKDSDLVLGAPLANLTKKSFKGTVFVPSNAALSNLVDALLGLAKVDKVPEGFQLLALPAVQDILKLHITTALIDPTKLTAENIGSDKAINITIDSTLLTGQEEQNLCPKTSSSTLKAVVNGTSGTDLEKVVIVSAGDDAEVVNATVKGVCSDSVIHIIDTVLLPCAVKDSAIPQLASTIAAIARNASIGTDGNGTRGLPSDALAPSGSPAPPPNAALAFSGSTIGTFAAAACAILIVSGTTFHTVMAVLTVLVGSVMVLATV